MSNFHVNYLTGSDSTGDGTTGNPWATLKYALENGPAIAGDVVKIAGSTTTDVDTAASPDSNNQTTVINTSVDLTGVLAVNDVIRVSPNMSDGPEFDGWMLTEIVSLNATSITTRAKWQFPNQATTNFTITKINDQILTPATSSESIASDTYIDVIVEGGYNNTFTSIVGLTFIVNSDVTAGSRAGNFYTFTSGTENVVTPLFKNFAMCRWQFGISTPFGKSAQIANLHILNGQGNPGGAGGFVVPTSLSEAGIYLNDVDNSFPYSGASAIFVPKAGENYIGGLKAYLNQNRDRSLNFSTGEVSGFVGYSVYYSTFGTSQFWSESINLGINGDISLVGYDFNAITTGFARNTGITAAQANINCNSLNIVRNGQTGFEYSLNLISNYLGKKSQGSSYIKLPTGSVLEDYLWASTSNAPTIFFPATLSIEDDNGIWNGLTNSILSKQNLVDQETGDSCLELKCLGGRAYSQFQSSGILAAFKSKIGATRLSSIEMRIKNVDNPSTNTLELKIQIGEGVYPLNPAAILSGSSIGTWTTVTFNIISAFQAGEYLLTRNTIVPMTLSNLNTDYTKTILIDSITPIYA